MIPVFKPSVGNEELAAIKNVLESGWIGLGPTTKLFEEEFADYIGCKYAVATNSSTAALHLALKVLEIDGREIITSPMTFISSNHAILYNNGIPVFSDIYQDTLNLDPNKMAEIITKKTKAILVVHYGGHSCDMDPIMEIANKYNLIIVEDAAHACGGAYKGKKIGSLGNIACFSFHAVKNLTTGEGGMVTTNDFSIYKRLIKLRWLGISKDTWTREENDGKYAWQYNVEELGYKYHMNDISAAIGRVQLKKLDKMNYRRQQIVDQYNQKLAGIKWLSLPVTKGYAKNAFHNYVVRTKFRNKLNCYLQEREINTGVHYIPNNHYEMYKKFKGRTPVSDKIWKSLLTLPLFPDLKDSEVDSIVAAIKEFGMTGINSK